ncbi:MAG: glycosyltransferase family 39 protein [Nocardioides sp.]|nr:glycosyltransferase family 39 protein [Nocardioides sp.]
MDLREATGAPVVVDVTSIAWRRIAPPAAVVVVLLSVFSTRYGFERDELYFSMLRPAWGYVDQPPFVPVVSHALTALVSNSPWLLRVPATLFAAGLVLLTALLARELGGDAKAQTWTAWGMATTSAVTVFGHVFLTSTPDLVFWPAVCLCVLRAELREQPRWWLAAGAIAGVATYNKLLVGVLLGGIALGLALVGPRRRLASPYVWGGAAIALVVALPNILYQVVNGWPELDMGRALSDNNAADVRVSMWSLLVLLLGPPMLVIWGAGLWALARDRRLRFFVVAFVVIVVFTFVSGTQAYYPVFLLPLPFAAGIVAMERHLGRVWAALFAVNGLVTFVLGLPVVPVAALGSTPIPGINQSVQDSIGWPTYVGQVGRVYDEARGGQDPGTVIVYTSNYGEAGAVHRYRPDIPVYSAQNALYDQAVPPADAATVVVVGGQWQQVHRLFDSCRLSTRLDNGVGVDNEEQGEPVGVCHGPRHSWATMWPRLRHLD